MESQVDDAVKQWESEDQSTRDRMLQVVWPSLYQRQDTLNRHAALMMQWAEVVEVPMTQLVMARARASELMDSEVWPALHDAPWYNPVGKLLLAIAGPAYSEYGLRIADLEGVRRLALLAVALHERQADPTVIPEQLKTSAWKDPYTGKPFTWDSASRELVFHGLESGERARQVIPYQAGS